MSIQVVVAALAVAVSIPILMYSVGAARTGGTWRLFGRKNRTLGDVSDVRQLVLERGAGERLGRPFVRRIGTSLRHVTPAGWVERMERKLLLAGLTATTSVEMILFGKVALSIVLFLFGWFGPLANLQFGRLITILLAGIAFFLPDAWVSRRAEQRQYRIQLELPDVLDQMKMSVDAGLGFEAALARAAGVGDGPLADELRRTVQEMQLGISRSEALNNLADRTEVPDLKSFVLAVVQSEQYGLPIAKVLGVQADELRDKRRQRAEERAMKIPVLLIFPLAVCIFPTIFIVLLGPALIRIYAAMQIVNP